MNCNNQQQFSCDSSKKQELLAATIGPVLQPSRAATKNANAKGASMNDDQGRITHLRRRVTPLFQVSNNIFLYFRLADLQ